jgi:DNA-binding NtrC family response regulator
MDPLTILVVDDAAAIRLLCRVNLELDGHGVVEAATLDEARAALTASDVAVVLLDVHVGQEDGLRLLAEIRERYPNVAVVLLTGSSDLERVSGHRPDAILGKPFELDELRRVVEGLAERTADV